MRALTRTFLAMVLTAHWAAASAAEPGMKPMDGMMGHHGMKGHPPGMMADKPGMMGCPMMSGARGGGAAGGLMGGRGLPAFPPGNEKLQMQMHAEIMQKVGEIMAKYAERIQSH